jgi:hypothetical protein
MRGAADEPEIQFLEVRFGALRQLNAVCHASGAAD